MWARRSRPRNARLACRNGREVAHVITATGAFGRAPYGATKRCTGWRRHMWSQPLGPSVELPMGPQNVVLGGED
eukprot:9474059-Pyramimonas_sp.AAC.1